MYADNVYPQKVLFFPRPVIGRLVRIHYVIHPCHDADHRRVCKKQYVQGMHNRSQDATLEQWMIIFAGPGGANRRSDLISPLLKKGECVPGPCA